MSFSDLFTSGFKQRNRDHFAAIVRVALSDGIVTDEEKAFLNRTAINLEIDDAEVAEIMANPDNYPINPPADEKSRLERLYDLTRMVYADNIADEEEVLLLNRLVIGLGFNTEDSSAIAQKALTHVANDADEDEFVAAF
ncbi:TerB family tellurite resistance protein [Flavobacteriaceae bacterium]|nr:TerB family tellurite resistance protein [Flavobacteriaceae bacterium]